MRKRKRTYVGEMLESGADSEAIILGGQQQQRFVVAFVTYPWAA